MKTILTTIALLVAVASMSVQAQSGSKAPDRRPTPTAGELPSSSQSSSTPKSGQKNSSATGSGSTRLQSGSGKAGSEATGTTSNQGSTKQRNKTGDKAMNQQAAGVPNKGSAAKLRTGQTSNNR